MSTLLFDLDDTLLIYNGVSAEAWEQSCQKYEQSLEKYTREISPHHSPLTPLQLKEAILQISHQYWSDPVRHKKGRLNLPEARREVVRQTFEFLNLLPQNTANTSKHTSPVAHPLSPFSPLKKLAHSIADTFTTLREELITPFPKAIEILQELKRRGHILGLLSNGSQQFQRAKIDRFQLAPYFNTILIEGELGFGKPDPRVFQKALRDLHSTPQETWMIGDHLEWDIQGAAALGIKTVWMNGEPGSTVLHAHNTNPANATTQPKSSTRPDHTIHHLAELLEIKL